MVLNAGDGSESGDGAYVKPSGNSAMNEGAVYAVAGSSGKLSTVKADWPHPIMVSYWEKLGSMVIDVDDNRLDAVFLDSTGAVSDSFTIVKATCSARRPMAANQWVFFSMPCMPADPRASRVFSAGPAHSGYDNRWTIYTYNSTTLAFEHVGADTALLEGKGYLLYSLDAYDWAQISGVANNGNPVALVTNADPSTGTWNLVGNPHNSTINWKDVTVYDGVTPYTFDEMDWSYTRDYRSLATTTPTT
jgi:hypothetical protein